MPGFRRQQAAVLATVALLVTVAASGCVRRRLTVRSNPPGAVVHVDNQRIGETPCSVDYVYYGTREVRLSAPGYETLTVNQPLPPPWYELPGIDFISENLVPRTIEDARTVSFNLRPQRMIPPEEIIARGEELRRQSTPAGIGPVVPAAATAPIDPAPVGVTPPPIAAPRATDPALSLPMGPPPSVGAPGFAPIPSAAPPAPGLPDTFRY
ncbi:MAG: PEGA domain-containing protein [Planctomycetota bacterium]